jgi:hypothetical protein
MQEVLIDRGQFVLENDIEEFDGDGIAGKGGVGAGTRRFGRYYAAATSAGFSSSISSIVSWHRPQFFLAPQRA